MFPRCCGKENEMDKQLPLSTWTGRLARRVQGNQGNGIEMHARLSGRGEPSITNRSHRRRVTQVATTAIAIDIHAVELTAKGASRANRSQTPQVRRPAKTERASVARTDSGRSQRATRRGWDAELIGATVGHAAPGGRSTGRGAAPAGTAVPGARGGGHHSSGAREAFRPVRRYYP